MKATEFLTSTLVVGSVLLGTLGQAEAASLFRSWEVRAANDKHVAWLPELISGGIFIADGDIVFDEFADETDTLVEARLYGDIVARDDPNKQWTIDVWFDYSGEGDAGAGSGGPKKELDPSLYSENGGPIDTSTWYYYEIDETRSILSADEGEYAGQTLDLFDITNGEYFVQIGDGASGKSTEFGLATWFGYTGSQTSSRHADFNIDLIAQEIPDGETGGNSTEIPEPAMGLLALGLVGLGMGSLKRKNP